MTIGTGRFALFHAQKPNSTFSVDDIDYCNSLVSGITKQNLHKIESTTNTQRCGKTGLSSTKIRSCHPNFV